MLVAEMVGEKVFREGLEVPDLGCEDVNPVAIGGKPRRTPCCWFEGPQADCCVLALLAADVGELL